MTSISSANPPVLVNNPVIRTWQWWTNPRLTDRDEAFRERTIRIVTLIIGVAVTLTLLTSLLIFGDPIEPLSYPTIFTVMLGITAATAFAISQKNVDVAGGLLVANIILGTSAVLLHDGYTSHLGVPGYMLAVIAASLVMARGSLVWVGAFCTVIVAIISYSQATAVPDTSIISPTELVTTTLAVLLTLSLLLRQLRIEFDLRLSDMRILIEQAEKSRDEADRANQAKSQFLANMSHELRTPLNAIIGYVEIMLNGMAGSFTEKQMQLLSFVHQNGRRLLALINDILDLAKIESGSIEVVAVPASPRKVVGDIIASMQSLAQKKGIYLKMSLADDVPEAVLCDVQKVQQIVTNLVGNSVKFTTQGGVDVIVGAPDAAHWEIKICDSGIGMPEDAAQYIFEKFRQVDNTMTREFQGTGLGLAIVKSLVDALNGTISLTTRMGEGTTFLVTLPRVYQN